MEPVAGLFRFSSIYCALLRLLATALLFWHHPFHYSVFITDAFSVEPSQALILPLVPPEDLAAVSWPLVNRSSSLINSDPETRASTEGSITMASTASKPSFRSMVRSRIQMRACNHKSNSDGATSEPTSASPPSCMVEDKPRRKTRAERRALKKARRGKKPVVDPTDAPALSFQPNLTLIRIIRWLKSGRNTSSKTLQHDDRSVAADVEASIIRHNSDVSAVSTDSAEPSVTAPLPGSLPSTRTGSAPLATLHSATTDAGRCSRSSPPRLPILYPYDPAPGLVSASGTPTPRTSTSRSTTAPPTSSATVPSDPHKPAFDFAVVRPTWDPPFAGSSDWWKKPPSSAPGPLARQVRVSIVSRPTLEHVPLRVGNGACHARNWSWNW